MRIIYLANIRLPTEKAHGYQIMRTCAELARLGHAVELVVPRRRNSLGERNPFSYYFVRETFKIRRLFCIDTVGFFHNFFGSLGFWLETLSFAILVKFFLKKNRADWVYSRDELLLKCLGNISQRVAVELHSVPSPKYNSLLRDVDCIFVITKTLKSTLVASGIAAEKIFIAPDAVDLEDFKNRAGHDYYRKTLWHPKIPQNKKVACYFGHLFPWKGVYTLAGATKYLSDDWVVLFAGGMVDDRKKLEAFIASNSLKKIYFWQHIPRYFAIPHLIAADVLVIPNSAKTDRSRLYTSPLKLFEYLAVGRPMVASDLPSIREVVSEREVIFVKPDDPQDLARGIREAGETDQSARVTAARKLAERYTWEARAKVILDALSALPKQEFSGRLTY